MSHAPLTSDRHFARLTRVLLVVGAPASVAARDASLEPGTRFLQKPYRGDELVGAIRSALDERAQTGSSSASSSAATTS